MFVWLISIYNISACSWGALVTSARYACSLPVWWSQTRNENVSNACVTLFSLYSLHWNWCYNNSQYIHIRCLAVASTFESQVHTIGWKPFHTTAMLNLVSSSACFSSLLPKPQIKKYQPSRLRRQLQTWTCWKLKRRDELCHSNACGTLCEHSQLHTTWYPALWSLWPLFLLV